MAGFELEDGTPIGAVSESGLGQGFELEDGTPINVDLSPTLRESAFQVAKDLGEGTFMAIPGMVGLASDAGNGLMRTFRSDLDPKESAFRLKYGPKWANKGKELFDYLAGGEIKNIWGDTIHPAINMADTVTGPVEDYTKAALQSIPYPGGVAANVVGGLGAEAAHKMLPNSSAAPIAGGVAASMIPAVLEGVAGIGRNLLSGATKQEIKGSAARALQEYTGLSPKQIEDAVKAQPKDRLGKLMTTAEVTDNAGAAQLEKALAETDQAAGAYKARAQAREEARGALLDATTATKAINKENLGSTLIEKAKGTQDKIDKVAGLLWNKVPRNEVIDVSQGQAAINSILDARQGGLPPGSKIQNLLEQFTAQDPKSPALSATRTSGALQDIRSDALTLLRDANLSPYETRLLSTMQDEIEQAMSGQLKGRGAEIWQTARDTTKLGKETFKRGSAGGSLVEPTARASNALSNALKGDAQSARELKAAIRNDPKLLEDVKRGVVDSIPRDAGGSITPAGMKKFLSQNEGSLREIFGEDHYRNMQRILADLQSEARVQKNAYLSSKGNSVTAQKSTVAGKITEVVAGAVLPGASTLAAQFVDVLKRAANIKDTAAVQEWLFKAAMDPEIAKELAKTGTTIRIRNWMERITDALKGGAKAGATAAGVQTARETNNDRQWKRLSPFSPQTRSLFSPQEGSLLSVPKKKEEASMVADLPPAIIEAVIQHESGGKADAVSDAGAVGLMQLLPETAAEIASELGLKNYDLKNPKTNKAIGTQYLKKLLDQFGNLELALTAYHSGPGRVSRLLQQTGGSSLEDIKQYLGPVGQRYAAGVLARLKNGTTA